MVWSDSPPEDVEMSKLDELIKDCIDELDIKEKKRIDYHFELNYTQIHSIADQEAEDFENSIMSSEQYISRKVGESCSTRETNRSLYQLNSSVESNEEFIFEYIGAKALKDGNHFFKRAWWKLKKKFLVRMGQYDHGLQEEK